VSHTLPLRYPAVGDLPAAGSTSPTDFGVTASATSGQVEVAVRGEIDAAAVRMLDSVLNHPERTRDSGLGTYGPTRPTGRVAQ